MFVSNRFHSCFHFEMEKGKRRDSFSWAWNVDRIRFTVSVEFLLFFLTDIAKNNIRSNKGIKKGKFLCRESTTLCSSWLKACNTVEVRLSVVSVYLFRFATFIFLLCATGVEAGHNVINKRSKNKRKQIHCKWHQENSVNAANLLLKLVHPERIYYGTLNTHNSWQVMEREKESAMYLLIGIHTFSLPLWRKSW